MASEIAARYQNVMRRVANGNTNVTVVAVSKTRSAREIREMYDLGHRDFGENYATELLEKARALPADIRWHMIGPLQEKNAKRVAKVPNLALIHSVSSAKIAVALNSVRQRLGAPPLDVLIQINSSQEASKSGVADTSAAAALAQFIKENCGWLRLRGVMGIPAPNTDTDPRRDYGVLKDALVAVSASLQEDTSKVLSMGMTDDFELAIAHGSTCVRIGRAFFGDRPPAANSSFSLGLEKITK